MKTEKKENEEMRREEKREVKELPVIRKDNEVFDSSKKGLGTELPPSQLVLYQIESASPRRFYPLPQLLKLVFPLIRRRRRRRRRRWRRRITSNSLWRRRLLPFLLFLFLFLPRRHFLEKSEEITSASRSVISN